ncbi:hypothetical protein [Methanobacterium virus PhiF1]|nr:hypothetical protein [Methanobacterium virus PhiF1]
MRDVDLIRHFRYICGEEYDDGYFLPVDNKLIPIYVGGFHEAEDNQIVIIPFTDKVHHTYETYYCEENPKRKVEVGYSTATFQVEVYTERLIDLMKTKTALINRIRDFADVEIIVFDYPIDWVVDSGVMFNPNITSEYNITRVEDDDLILKRLERLSDIISTPNSWMLTDDGIYVNHPSPENLKFSFALNGLVFPNGETSWDIGIQTIVKTEDSYVGVVDPGVCCWLYEFLITYREGRDKRAAGRVREVEVYGEKEEW